MSGRKLVVLPYVDPLINGQSMAASITGTPINIQYTDVPCMHFVWTGSNPVGLIKFQVSINYNQNFNTGTWSTYQSTPGTDFSIAPGGAAGDYFINFTQPLASPWIRAVYTTAGGSVGNLTFNFGCKEE